MKKCLIFLLVTLLLPGMSRAQDGSEPPSPFMSIKTNLLYWTGLMPDFHYYTPVPNLEVEWYFKRSWSVAVSGNYVKRAYGEDRFFGLSAWSVEPRWWPFQKGRYRWLVVGIYMEAGDYDFQHGRLTYDGNTGRLIGCGGSVGAAIAFSRHWGVEVGIRGGFRHDSVNSYSFEKDCPYLEEKSVENFWGVTGLKLSLYYRFALKKSKTNRR